MANIGLVSDLHLEASNFELNNPGWDYLVIAGDLSADFNKLQNFFEYYAPHDIPIIYVLGNHEYEGRRLDTTPLEIKSLLSEFKNVHLLDNESIIIDNIKFIGATLWSNFELEGIHKKEECMQWSKFNIADFSYIFDKNEHNKYVTITPERMDSLNKEACEFIKSELEDNKFNGVTVVVSHFAPHKNSVFKDYNNKMNGYWVNHLENLVGISNYWLHGHTHHSFNYKVGNTNVICNPRGFSKVFNIAQNISFQHDIMLPIEDFKETKETLVKLQNKF